MPMQVQNGLMLTRFLTSAIFYVYRLCLKTLNLRSFWGKHEFCPQKSFRYQVRTLGTSLVIGILQ